LSWFWTSTLASLASAFFIHSLYTYNTYIDITHTCSICFCESSSTEALTKPGPNGTPAHFPSPGYGPVVPSTPVRLLGIVLRGLAMVLTLVATIVMGVAKQSAVVLALVDYSGELVDVKRTAKSTDFLALV